MWKSELLTWAVAKQRGSLYFGEPETLSLLVSVHVSAETKDQALSSHLTRHMREFNHVLNSWYTGIPSQGRQE